MWFRQLVGFDEINPEQVRENLDLEGEYISSRVNGKRYKCGTLEIPSLEELRTAILLPEPSGDQINISEIIADVSQLHLDPQNRHSVIQAASQFNLLEMVGPEVTPEAGIDIYEDDFTQGPACAIACGAGTIFRNYFVPVRGRVGQTADNQINCLADLQEVFAHETIGSFYVQNGYAFIDQDTLQAIGDRIQASSDEEYEYLKGNLRVGIQWDTEITIGHDRGELTQIYCSALPIGYSSVDAFHWEPFARLILDATYEATFLAALKNYRKTGNNRLFLTLVGGGVFGNDLNWILDSIRQCLEKFRHTPLDVAIVSYRVSNAQVRQLVDSF